LGTLAILTLLTGLITTFLTLLVTATIVVTGTITATLVSATLQTCAKTLGTEAAFIVIVVMETRTLKIRALSCMYTWTR
jgi:hypothetical protein